MPEIRKIIDAVKMTDHAKEIALRIFNIIAEAEAKAHAVPVEQVHFHEVGAIDSIVDVVAAAVCLDDLHIDEVVIPKLCEGTGTVRCQHGVLPVPVPAVANIVEKSGLNLEIMDIKGEFVTPTGAAIAAAEKRTLSLFVAVSIAAGCLAGCGGGSQMRFPPCAVKSRGCVSICPASSGGLNIPIIGYQGSVLPALILGAIAAKIEKGLRKIVPDVLDLIVTPFITLLSSLFIGLIVIGPIMHMVEQGLVVLISMLMNIPFGIGGFMVGALQQAVVITGLHHTFKALEIELLANTGANPFNALVCGAIVAQGAAGIAAALKTKNKKQRSLYFTSVVPAFLGITEPLIFGGNLPRLTPFICGCIGGFA